MSKYTTEVRYICEQYAGKTESVGYDEVDDVIEDAAPQIFESYPIFDELYRLALNKKILRHYYTREIGAETVGLWKLWLNTKMKEIMPYYNQLYLSATLDFNPLYDVNYTRTHQGSDGGENQRGFASSTTRTSESSSSDDTTDKFSDTPQGGITGVADGMYLTNARITNVSASASDESGENRQDAETSSFSNTNEYIESVAGKMGGGTYSKMIMEYREAMLNIDMLIIDELADLFMKIY